VSTTHCNPDDPSQLWMNHYKSLIEDHLLRLPYDDTIQLALQELNHLLLQSKSDNGIPVPITVCDEDCDQWVVFHQRPTKRTGFPLLELPTLRQLPL